MSRKKIFDNVIEKAIGSGILESDVFERFVRGLGDVKGQESVVDGSELFDSLKRLLIMRAKKRFEEVVYDLEKGFPVVKRFLSQAREVLCEDVCECFIGCFIECFDEGFNRAIREYSDIASELFAIYVKAKNEEERLGNRPGYVWQVVKKYADGFFDKLFISSEKTMKFCEIVDKIYREIESLKKVSDDDLKEDLRKANGKVKRDVLERLGKVVKGFVDEVEIVFPYESVMREVARGIFEVYEERFSKFKVKGKRKVRGNVLAGV